MEIGIRDIEFDCFCCHAQESHSITKDAERGACLREGCDCGHYRKQEFSAFFQMLAMVSGLLSREEKMEALVADSFDLEEWLERYRNVPWPNCQPAGREKAPRAYLKAGNAPHGQPGPNPEASDLKTPLRVSTGGDRYLKIRPLI